MMVDIRLGEEFKRQFKRLKKKYHFDLAQLETKLLYNQSLE